MKKRLFGLFFSTVVLVLFIVPLVAAQPYGEGSYNEAVPYGDLTSLSIDADASTTIPLTPTAGGTLVSGNATVTVTSTDVNGFQLYIRADASTDLSNGPSLIPSSANSTAAALSTNTWGYNTDATANYKGVTLTDALLTSLNTTATSGHTTTVTYGIKVDLTKPAGNYSTTVLYTAVPQTI